MFKRQEPVRSSPALSAPQPFPYVSGAWGSGMVSGGASDFIVYVLIHVTWLSLFVTNTSWLRVCVPCATEDRCPRHLLVVSQGMGSPPSPLSPLPSSSLSSSSSPSPSASPSLFPSLPSSLLSLSVVCENRRRLKALKTFNLHFVLFTKLRRPVLFYYLTSELLFSVGRLCDVTFARGSHLRLRPLGARFPLVWVSAQAEVRASHPGRL